MEKNKKSPEQELVESIGLMIDKGLESTTDVYTGVVKSVDGKRAVVSINGRNQNVAISSAAVASGNVVRVFVPRGNMSAAFIVKAESNGGGGATTTAYGDLTEKPQINGVTLVDNKTSKELNLYGTGNAPPYPVTSVNGKTGDVTISTGGNVDSVNGKTGAVVLNKSDVGLGNVDNVRQYSTSNPPPYPVQSVDGATGAVVTNAVKTTPQSLSDAQKQQARNNIGAGTSNFSGSYNDLSNKPTIPDPYTLPVANSNTLGGVKPVSKTDSMTQSVGVDENGKLYTSPGSGGGGTSSAVTSVNGKTGDVELTASDVGALPSNTELPTPFYVGCGIHSENTYDESVTHTKTYDEILAAYKAGHACYARVKLFGADNTNLLLLPLAEVDEAFGYVNFALTKMTQGDTSEELMIYYVRIDSDDNAEGYWGIRYTLSGNEKFLPSVTTSDNGKSAVVVNGAWATVDKTPFYVNCTVAGPDIYDEEVTHDKTYAQILSAHQAGRPCYAVVDFSNNTKRYLPLTELMEGDGAMATFSLAQMVTGDAPEELQVFYVSILPNDAEGFWGGRYTATTDNQFLPPVTPSDNGKFLRVVNGAWLAVTIPDANGGSF